MGAILAGAALPRRRVARVSIAAHIARLRAAVGHDLLLLPSVSVVPVDQAGRILLVRHAGHHDGWGVLGGAIDVGESPGEAAVREAREEIGVEVQLVRLLDVLGGPDYEVAYPNGDRAAYVTTVYEAMIIDGSPADSSTRSQRTRSSSVRRRLALLRSSMNPSESITRA